MHHLLRDPEFWVLVSFVIFFLLFGHRLWVALMGMLDSRTAAIRAELDEAQRLRAEAEAMLAEAERARAEAQLEAQRLLARSHAEAASLAAAAASEADAAAKRRERVAVDRIAAAEKAALLEIRQVAADVAVSAARQVIADGAAGDRLLDRSISDLPRALRAA